MNVTFEQGHVYVAGADRPFFVSPHDIESGAAGIGFSGAHVFDRDDPKGWQAPQPIIARAAADGHTDDWNTIGLGAWTRPTATIEVPGAVKWIYDLGTGNGAAPSTALEGGAATESPVLTLEAVAGPWRRFLALSVLVTATGAGALGWWLGKRRR